MIVKKTSFNPHNLFELACCRSIGQSIEAEVDRPVRSTNVHKRAWPYRLEGQSTGSVDCQRALLSGSGPDRPGSRSAKSSALCIHASVDQAVDRQQRQLLIWPPTAIFWEPINWGSLGLFSTRFKVGFQASFSYLSECLSPLILEQILSYQKESFSSVFCKRDFLSFSSTILSSFITHT